MMNKTMGNVEKCRNLESCYGLVNPENSAALDGFDVMLKESHIPSFRQSAENPKIREIFSQEFGICDNAQFASGELTLSFENYNAAEKHDMPQFIGFEQFKKEVMRCASL